MRLGRAGLVLQGVLLAGVLQACGAPTVPEPEVGPPRDDAAIDVGHPPPAALPEIVSAQPDPAAVWIDGRWVWRGQNWVWERGGWARVPSDAKVTPWRVWYERDGSLRWADSQWFNAQGTPLDAPPIVAPAGSPPTAVLSEDATTP